MSGARLATAASALAVVFNALVWGLSWWPLRELGAAGLHPLWATAFIYVIGVLTALALAPQGWRHLARERGLWLLALASGLTNVGFNWAVTVGDVVRVVLVFYTMPAWSLLLAWLLLGERPTALSLLRLALGLGGLLVVLWPADGATLRGGAGLAEALGLMGGISFALTAVMLRRLAHTPGPARMMAMFGGGATLALLGALLAMGLGLASAPPAPSMQWMPMALALALAFILGNLSMQYGAARLSAAATAMLLLTEVVFASVSSVLLGAADLGPRTLIGGALILLASLLALPGGPPAAGTDKARAAQ